MAEKRTITVILPDTTSIYIDNVPASVTCHDLLEKINGIDVVSKTFNAPFHLRVDNRMLFDWEAINSDTLTLGLLKDEKRTPAFIILFFVFCHIFPLFLKFIGYSNSISYFTYMICMIIYGIICLISKPNFDISHYPFSKIPVLGIFYLFFQSLSPTFTLESILLDNHN